jgi:hypothetical protein
LWAPIRLRKEREKENGRKIKVNHDRRAVIFTEEGEGETW